MAVVNYYRQHFPFQKVCAWLSPSDDLPLDRREISHGESFRYKYWRDSLDAAVKTYPGPDRLDYGGVYAYPPIMDNSSFNFPTASELRIDIDDWKRCQTCLALPTEKDICPQCLAHQMYPSMQRIIDHVKAIGCAKDDEIFVFYSGGRSLHGVFRSRELLYTTKAQRIAFMKGMGVDEGPLCPKHLLRLPFSVNMSTNRVCVPVNMSNPGSTPYVRWDDCARVAETVNRGFIALG